MGNAFINVSSTGPTLFILNVFGIKSIVESRLGMSVKGERFSNPWVGGKGWAAGRALYRLNGELASPILDAVGSVFVLGRSRRSCRPCDACVVSDPFDQRDPMKRRPRAALQPS